MPASQALLETIRSKLFSAVIGDVLDSRGYHHQFLPPEIRPLTPDMVVVGRAMTVLEADCTGDRMGHSGEAAAFGLMFKALDELQADEVYLATGGSPDYAFWGEMMSTRARVLGAAGAVLNGPHRDTAGVLEQGLPVFSVGAFAQDQRMRGRVIDYRCPIEFPNRTRVEPGDIVVGDRDGVVIIPSAVEAEIVELALAKVAGEQDVQRMLEEGVSTQEVFRRTGIM
ncbi:RraA family protein [Aquibaculum sediminis]|uniref:RraA family protein n=1 Tax=Aquibaculum sediminis TaxID=3231907 RepID=UPI0034567851